MQGPTSEKVTYPALGYKVPTYTELQRQYGVSTDKLCNDHEKIIEKILEEEECLINDHRTHIDEIVAVVKDEMSLINDVDKPGSDVQFYVKKLDNVLLQKIEIITKLREKVLNFHHHLKTEELMS